MTTMMRYILVSLCLLVIGKSSLLLASEHGSVSRYQEIALIQAAVEDFVYRNIANAFGQVIVTVDKIDPHMTLPNCRKLEPFTPTGARLWGKSSVGVRCNGDTAWTIYVQVDIKVMADVLHIVRPVSKGKSIDIEDVTPQNVNLAQMPEGIYTDTAQVIGKIATNNLSAGQPLRSQMLRAPYVILRGQKVSMIAKGRGFSVSSEGQALSDAAEGQIVQIRSPSGRVISGIARENSTVEISQ